MISREQEKQEERGSLALCGMQGFSALGLDCPGSALGFQRGHLQAVSIPAEELTNLGEGFGCLVTHLKSPAARFRRLGR